MTKAEISTGLFGKPDLLTEAKKSFLAEIIASSNDAIISKDLEGTICSWNEGAHRIFGYEAEEIVGKSILRLIPPDLHPEEEFILAKIRAGERIEHFETTRVKKNGELFPISVTISPIKNDDGKIIGASKIGRDISDRWREEHSRAQLAAIVDSADDAIVSKNLDGIVTSWNGAAQRLFGYEEKEMIGQSIRRIVPENLYYEEDEILNKLRNGEKIDHYETTRVSKTGEIREVSITISPIRNTHGEVIGGSKIARDISDRKKVERLAIQVEKLAVTGRMAASIAHEINNPLASIVNLVYLARQDGLSKQEIRNYLSTAESELDRVAHIARQTLGYYHDTASPSEVSLRDLMANVLSAYRNKLIAHHITVETRFDDLRKISVHSGEIVQVFSNVVSNAIDAMPRTGKLSISMTRTMKPRTDSLQIIVTDNGRGIRGQDLGKVFEPFFTTKGDLGTGIGLWVTKQLVDRHRGHISIASSTEPSACGTTVTIYLPFSTPENNVVNAGVFEANPETR